MKYISIINTVTVMGYNSPIVTNGKLYQESKIEETSSILTDSDGNSARVPSEFIVRPLKLTKPVNTYYMTNAMGELELQGYKGRFYIVSYSRVDFTFLVFKTFSELPGKNYDKWIRGADVARLNKKQVVKPVVESVVITPSYVASLIKKGCISRKITTMCKHFNITLIKGKSNYYSKAHNTISLIGFRSKYDLAVALHELCHYLRGHTENTVQNECEADLFSDAVCEILYKNGGYLFGDTLKADDNYTGELDTKALYDFAKSLNIDYDHHADLLSARL